MVRFRVKTCDFASKHSGETFHSLNSASRFFVRVSTARVFFLRPAAFTATHPAEGGRGESRYVPHHPLQHPIAVCALYANGWLACGSAVLLLLRSASPLPSCLCLPRAVGEWLSGLWQSGLSVLCPSFSLSPRLPVCPSLHYHIAHYSIPHQWARCAVG